MRIGKLRGRAAALLAAALVVGVGAPITASPAQAAPAPAAGGAPAAAAAAPTSAAAASVVPAAAPAGPASYRHGVVPMVGTAPVHGAGQIPADSSSNLVYWGGNGGVGVTTGAPKVYLVFWGSQWGTPSTNGQGYLTLSGDPQKMAPDLQGFMKGLGTGGETWSGVMTQYCEGVAVGAQDCPANAIHVGYPTGGALAGVWADTAGAAPASASAHQLAMEAVNAAIHFGNSTSAANRNIQYFIVSPTGTAPDGFPGTGFCAWHDFSADSTLTGGGAVSGPAVAFTNMPYLTDAAYDCGLDFVNSGSAGALDGVTIVGGHEYAETITDQFPAGGWLDSAQQQENGDLCAWIAPGSGQGSSQDISLATGSFAVQSTWSNDFNGGTGDCAVSHPTIANVPPAITSAATTTFTAGTSATFTVSTTGAPLPSVAETGSLPSGVSFVDNHDGTATLSGSAAVGSGGSYPLTLTAANGVGTNAHQSFTLTVNGSPAITSTASATFTVGLAASLTVTATGTPLPTLGEAGTLPSGVTFNAATKQLSGTAAIGTAGSYPITFTATNGVGSPATQNFTLIVNVASFTYPTDGLANIDTTLPFTWSTIPQAQNYLLYVGTTLYGNNLVSSAILPATQSSFAVPSLPSAPTVLHATLFSKVNGAWSSFQAISFTASPGQAALTSPQNGQSGVDPTAAFTWTTIPGAQGYAVLVGTSQYGANVAFSGALPPTQSSYTPPTMPAGVTLYATLYTKVNGAYSRYQAITFTARKAMGLFVHPFDGQTNIGSPTTFTWSTVAAAQGYFLIVGTTLYGSNIANSGVLPATQSSFTVPTLPKGKILYATLLTEINGAWVFQVIGFGT